MAGPADFDPEDTRADPAHIREQAEGFRRVGGQLTGRQDSLRFVLRSLATSFSEVLHPLIGARIDEQFYTLQTLVGAMLYAAQVTDGWAADVVAFRQRQAELLWRWESAQRNGFWVTRAQGYDNIEPEMIASLYDDARHVVLRELNAEADLAYATLSHAAADRGRQFREGPSTANVMNVMNTGLAGGPGIALLYPYLAVPGPSSGLPRQYWGLTADQLVRACETDPTLAALLATRRPDLSAADPYEAALARAVLIAGGELASGSAYGAASAERITKVSEVLAGIPAEDLALLSALFPAVAGNLNGMPFQHRISANRVNVAHALSQAQDERVSLLAEIEQSQPARFTDPTVRSRIEDLNAQIDQYHRLLEEPTVDYGAPGGPPWPEYRGRKVVYFTPVGTGAWAELVGTIDAGTQNVGILVPGVGTDMQDMSRKSDQVTEFVAQAARDDDHLAMIVWAGGDFPNALPGALSGGYVEDLALPLVDFSVAVRHEVDSRGASGHVPVTVIGHSYGGLAVSLSTVSGLCADRLLFVNSAGMGTGEVSQLANYDAYAMDTPGDLVSILGPLIHEPAPIDQAGVVELETGTYRDGTTISGIAGHSGVFQESSTAWENMLAVLIGRV